MAFGFDLGHGSVAKCPFSFSVLAGIGGPVFQWCSESNHFVHILSKVRSASNPPLPISPIIGAKWILLLLLLYNEHLSRNLVANFGPSGPPPKTSQSCSRRTQTLAYY